MPSTDALHYEIHKRSTEEKSIKHDTLFYSCFKFVCLIDMKRRSKVLSSHWDPVGVLLCKL